VPIVGKASHPSQAPSRELHVVRPAARGLSRLVGVGDPCPPGQARMPAHGSIRHVALPAGQYRCGPLYPSRPSGESVGPAPLGPTCLRHGTGEQRTRVETWVAAKHSFPGSRWSIVC
jgi:hypothetical protein